MALNGVSQGEYGRDLDTQAAAQLAIGVRLDRLSDITDNIRLWIIILAFASGGNLVLALLHGTI